MLPTHLSSLMIPECTNKSSNNGFEKEKDRLQAFAKDIFSKINVIESSLFDKIIVQQKRYERGNWQDHKACEKRRECMKISQKKMLKQILPRYCCTDQSEILELGSGRLSHTNESHLSSRFPFPYKKWTFSDYKETAALHSHRVTYLDLDIANQESQSKTTYDCMVGSNVLDTISYKHFPQVFSTAKKMLKPGGFFIHVADMNFFYEGFIDACSLKKDHVILPSENSYSSLIAVGKKRYFDTLKQQADLLSKSEMSFFQLWGNYDTQIQTWFIQNTILGSSLLQDYDDNQWKNLLKKIQQIFTTTKKEILRRSFYIENYLKNAATQNEFSTLQCGFLSRSFCIHRPTDAGQPNYFINTHQIFLSTTIHVLAPNKTMYKNTMHFFIARNANTLTI